MSGNNRVKRGGSWNNNARNCRVANRNNNNPDNSNNNLGFRLASTIHGKAGTVPFTLACVSQKAGTKTIEPAGPVRLEIKFPTPCRFSIHISEKRGSLSIL
ncbi:MAG: SUMF1/EgtB/PvdO family nonheme iron enzyme [Verrucomicrobiota bacterium]|nr:SUMF1/EgtB/PvdO family nonheme iron enzyme [Verrucomicrobiota bacterium]